MASDRLSPVADVSHDDAGAVWGDEQAGRRRACLSTERRLRAVTERDRGRTNRTTRILLIILSLLFVLSHGSGYAEPRGRARPSAPALAREQERAEQPGALQARAAPDDACPWFGSAAGLGGAALRRQLRLDTLLDSLERTIGAGLDVLECLVRWSPPVAVLARLALATTASISCATVARTALSSAPLASGRASSAAAFAACAWVVISFSWV